MNSGASESHVGITVPQQRKPLNPSPVFTPSPNPSPNLPFMPLQLPTSNSSTYSSYFSSSASTSYGFSHEPPVGTFKEEPPLLEELGINTELILKKILSALNPLRISTALHKDADLSGPFVICMALGFLQLLSGKIQFGVITGWTCLASFFVYVVFNMLAGREGNLDLYRCLSVVGYSMLPLVLFSVISLIIPPSGKISIAMVSLTVLWCCRICTTLLVSSAPETQQLRKLVAYPCILIFLLFSFLVVF